MQIAGNQCVTCHQPIVFGCEGKICGGCGTVTHLECETAANCPVCGDPFEYHRLSEHASALAAYDPREKRAHRSVGPLLAALFSLLLAILVFFVMTLT